MILFLDADSIVYQSACPCDKPREGVIDPVSYALHNVKKKMNSILSKINPLEQSFVYLGGKDNFRDKVATYQKYKANRPPKPTHYGACREYLVKNYGGILVDGEEAEDRVSIEHMKIYREDPTKPIIGFIDKDLKNTPGWHYNFVTEEKTFISDEEAIYNFYKQLLMGDRADTILGIEGMGPKTAEKIIKVGENEESLFNRVRNQYMLKYPKDGEKRMLEMGQLLWIRQNENELWEFPI